MVVPPLGRWWLGREPQVSWGHHHDRWMLLFRSGHQSPGRSANRQSARAL